MDSWQGLFFQMIYVVFFGLPGQIAKLDQIETVGGPRCVATICYYGDMWKKFDRGLHEFLKKYIYIACGGNQHGTVWQMATSLLCFLYVGFWHGGSYVLFYWVLLNYVEVAVEGLASLFYRQKHVITTLYDKLGERNLRRLQGVATVPLHAASLISIHSFFDDIDVFWLYIDRFLLHGNFGYYLATFIGLYFFVQVSLEADIWEAYWEGKIDTIWKSDKDEERLSEDIKQPETSKNHKGLRKRR